MSLPTLFFCSSSLPTPADKPTGELFLECTPCTSSTRRTRQAAAESVPYSVSRSASSYPLLRPTLRSASLSGFDAILSSISVIQTFDPVHAGEGLDDDGKPFAALHGLRRRGAGAMSLFPGGSAQPEPLLGLPGASSHLQATVPTLLQALSASESTAPPRGPKKQARCRQRLLAGLAGWPQARAAGAWCGAGHGSQLAEASDKLAMGAVGKAAAAGARLAALTPLATWIVSAHWP